MDIKAFHVIAISMEGVLEVFFFDSQREAESSAKTQASTVNLEIGKQPADFFG